jgi:hypothetical protein
MRIRTLLMIGLLALGVGVALTMAQERDFVEPTEADIGLDNSFFFRIRTPAAGYKVSEREKVVNERIVAILSCHKPGPVTIAPINGKPTIYVDGVKLVTVYPRDAEANKATMMEVATVWAANLRAGLPKVMPGAHPNGPARPACVCPGGPQVSVQK